MPGGGSRVRFDTEDSDKRDIPPRSHKRTKSKIPGHSGRDCIDNFAHRTAKSKGIHRGRQTGREGRTAPDLPHGLNTERVHQTNLGKHQKSHGARQRHQNGILNTNYTCQNPRCHRNVGQRRTLHRVYVFTRPTGKPVCGSSLLRWMEMHTGCTVHDLWHTYAIRARLTGVDIEVLQRLLGHLRVETTLGIYRHVSDAEIETAAAKFGANCNRSATE